MNNGTLTMINCTVTGNVCPWLGGGIANNGTLSLKSCTIWQRIRNFGTKSQMREKRL